MNKTCLKKTDTSNFRISQQFSSIDVDCRSIKGKFMKLCIGILGSFSTLCGNLKLNNFNWLGWDERVNFLALHKNSNTINQDTLLCYFTVTLISSCDETSTKSRPWERNEKNFTLQYFGLAKISFILLSLLCVVFFSSLTLVCVSGPKLYRHLAMPNDIFYFRDLLLLTYSIPKIINA